MIAAEIADLIGSTVMIVVATADRTNKAAIGRSTGARFDRPSGQVELFVSRQQWPGVFVDLEPGAPIAATFVNPQTYRTVQIKGRLSGIAPAAEADLERAIRYREQMIALMDGVGVSLAQLSQTMGLHDLVRLRYMPTDVFNQTPGPQAGIRLRTGSIP